MKEDKITINMEESAMTTRIGGKVTSSYGEVSASTACDDKTMQTNTQQVGSKVTRGKVRNVACPYARHRELGKKELKLLTTNKHVDETERQILLNSRPLNGKLFFLLLRS